ncbi:PucR family transcriptional regulator, partial [Streptomyces sp. SID14478]|nr:PucR family transcriptional regulator [Streptomyces sp. SID14478]
MPAAVRSAWRDVPSLQVKQFAGLAMDEAPRLAQDILDEIRREFPHLPLLLDPSGEPLALVGIRRAIEGFVRRLTDVSDDTAPQEQPPVVFQEFGRGQSLHGRSLDALQAMYRLGVKLAWRRLADLGQRLRIPPPAMYELAESGYEYLDGLVDQSVRGYAEAAARQAGERLRQQRRLMDLLLEEGAGRAAAPPDPVKALTERAAGIGWPVPERVSVGVLLRPARDAV